MVAGLTVSEHWPDFTACGVSAVYLYRNYGGKYECGRRNENEI